MTADTTADFALDHRLADSSVFIADWALCRVSLKKDKTWPWLYLVPRSKTAHGESIREICDLTAEDQAQLMREISRASRVLKALYNADKINIAAYGNMVPQLHIHVFARLETDPAWPKPVWAVQREEMPYTDLEQAAEIEKIKNCLAKITA